MKLLFLSGVDVGGAPQSTIELARLLAERGHEIRVLLGDRPDAGSLYGRLERLHLKSETWPVVGPGGRFLAGFLGRRRRGGPLVEGRIQVEVARLPENALQRLLREFQPDVVVVNSFPRLAMRWISAELRRSVTPFVLYLREAHATTHLTVSGLRPDAVIANSRELQRAASDAGVEAAFVPSVVDLSAATVESTRRAIVLVNPVPENRPELLVAMADARPDLVFALQESWPLDPAQSAHLGDLASNRKNLEVRRRIPSPARLFADVAVLVATYPAGRPRVVLEAQHNGIPILAMDQPALAEAVGPGGVLVDSRASETQWLAALGGVLDDEAEYQRLSAAARNHARRAEVEPRRIADAFEQAMIAVSAERRVKSD